MTVEETLAFEVAWWGTCVNTYQEETKQLTYADRMGLATVEGAGQWPLYDLAGKSILDLGGGPISMLLKTVGGERLVVVDPGGYPNWIVDRYKAHGIQYLRQPAEDYERTQPSPLFDECWIYNVLQHVQDPARVIAIAKWNAALVRIFEWVNIDPYLGHPHKLTQDELDAWLGGEGRVEWLERFGGTAYYGIFPTLDLTP